MEIQRGEEILKLTADSYSAQAAWDVVVSHYKMAAFAKGKGDAAGETKHYRACYNILAPRLQGGMVFDPPIINLFQSLKEEFGE